jgi:hypothetical protein
VVLQKPLTARLSPRAGEGEGEQEQVWRIERRGKREIANEMSAGCDVIMWRRPAMAVLVLACGTLIYYHCAVRNRNIVALISDVLFVISWSLALLGLIFRFLNLTYVCLAGSLSLSLSLIHTHTHTLSVSVYMCVYVWVCWCGCFLGAVVFLSLQCMNETDWDARCFCSFAAIVFLEPIASGVGALFLSCNPRQKHTIEHWVTKLARSVFRGYVCLVWT